MVRAGDLPVVFLATFLSRLAELKSLMDSVHDGGILVFEVKSANKT